MPIDKKQVYIVDNDASVCRALAILLDTHGFTVSTFTSAVEFFNAAPPKGLPGCLVLDIHMPGLDGWDVLQLLLVSRYSRPVIIISADKASNLKETALKAGAIGYLQKPFNDCELVDLIKIALEKKR